MKKKKLDELRSEYLKHMDITISYETLQKVVLDIVDRILDSRCAKESTEKFVKEMAEDIGKRLSTEQKIKLLED